MFNGLSRIVMLENEISIIIDDFDKSWELCKLLKKLSEKSVITYEEYLTAACGDLRQGMSINNVFIKYESMKIEYDNK